MFLIFRCSPYLDIRYSDSRHIKWRIINLIALITEDFAAGAETSARFLTKAPRTPAERSFVRTSMSWAALPTTRDPRPNMFASFRVVRIVYKASTPWHLSSWQEKWKQQISKSKVFYNGKLHRFKGLVQTAGWCHYEQLAEILLIV